MTNVPDDWVDDDSMSAEETMRRFNALGPTATTGPVKRNFAVNIVVGAQISVHGTTTDGPLRASARRADETLKLAADPRQQPPALERVATTR